MVKKLKAMADKKAANPTGLLDNALAQTIKDWLSRSGSPAWVRLPRHRPKARRRSRS